MDKEFWGVGEFCRARSRVVRLQSCRWPDQNGSVGVDSRRTAFGRLSRESGHSCGDLQRHTGNPVYGEPASEWLIMRYVRGAPVRLWERIPGRRSESLDYVIYGMAVTGLSRPIWTGAKVKASATLPKNAPVVVKSAWLTR
ncbi:hypothetical protein XW59_005220 [Aquamicrobium sp. LC103]|nr:hypothetical protein XW59_005220 [Aquamicrobium sp. LC103]